MSSLQHIHVPDPDITIYIDSGILGWVVTDEKNQKNYKHVNNI